MASRIILWDWECWCRILFKKARKKRVWYHPGQSHRFIISKKQKIEPSVGKKIILIPAKRRRNTKDRLCSVCTLCTQIPTRYLFWQLTLQCSLSRLEDRLHLRYFCGPSKWPLFWSLTKLLLQRCTRRPGLPPDLYCHRVSWTIIGAENMQHWLLMNQTMPIQHYFLRNNFRKKLIIIECFV